VRDLAEVQVRQVRDGHAALCTAREPSSLGLEVDAVGHVMLASNAYLAPLAVPRRPGGKAG
jgi:hypothetical protein